MDFSYYNNENKEIKLQISAGMNWQDLNVQNQSLNSIFSKVDDGDGKISERELSLLEMLFKKADGIVESSAGNYILENNELKELERQIDDNRITIPVKKFVKNLQNIQRQGYIEVQHSAKEMQSIAENAEEFYDKELEQIKSRLTLEFPSDKYELDIYRHKRGYEYIVYAPDIADGKQKIQSVPKTFSSKMTIIRSDGIELELEDSHFDDIINDDNADNSKAVRGSGTYGDLTVTDKNGKKHEMSYSLIHCWNRDVLDCRRVAAQVSKFLGNMDAETINKLMEIDFCHIDFDVIGDNSEVEPDENGNIIQINDDGTVLIQSPLFAIPEREYQKFSIERDDGFKFDVTESGDYTASLNITFPDNQEVKLELDFLDRDYLYQFMLPKLKEVLEQLPASVLKDLSNEVSKIKLLEDLCAVNGMYPFGSNTITYRAGTGDYGLNDVPVISFVHELGHAIDNQNGDWISNSAEFKTEFDKFKNLYTKSTDMYNYALTNPQEFFASMYAYLEYPEDDRDYNHIWDIESNILKFKDSTTPEEQECYELFYKLKQDVQILLEKTRNAPKSVRADDHIGEIVRTECAELIKQSLEMRLLLEDFSLFQSFELDMIQMLSFDEATFNSQLRVYRNNLNKFLPGQEKEKMFMIQFIDKLVELRTKIYNNPSV